MKKLFFTLTMVMMICMLFVACSNSTNDIVSTTNNDISQIEIVEETAPLPTVSDEFIQNSLQFIDEFPNQSKKLEDLSFELIQQSSNYKDTLYSYLSDYIADNYSELWEQYFENYNCDKVNTVQVWIHNYQVGNCVPCVTFNGQSAYYNYNHDPIFLSAGVLGKKYPDNITLAEARIASYVLLHMDIDDVDCCIKKSSDGKYSYDFTFQNDSFKEVAKKTLQNLNKE